MIWYLKCIVRVVRLLAAAALVCLAMPPCWAGTTAVDDMIGRANDQVSKFVEQFSDVKCTEHVLQEKFKADGKIELKSDSTFDYLVILTNAGARSAWTNPVWRCTRRRRIRKRAFLCW